MSRQLSSGSSLETLRKEAKRWLKAVRAGDVRALERFRVATGSAAGAATGLRDVQLALAREYGLPGWSALRLALDDLALARRSQGELVDLVLRASTWSGDKVAAERILRRWPALRTHDFCIAVATGNLAEVARRLASDPAVAGRKGGALDWEPLLYLAYARLPGGETNGVEIARTLLDRGAGPNVQWVDDWNNPFTVLTGVIGEGEGVKAPHPQAREIAALLVERGADPFDTQALYNTSITRDDVWWLEFLWTACEARGTTSRWFDGKQTQLSGNTPLNAIDYLIGNAVAFDHPTRAEWLLTHGANAKGIHAYSKRPLLQEALIYGHQRIAELLVQFGAEPVALRGKSAFQAACMRLDREAARAALSEDPSCLSDPETMLEASRAGRADVVALLLELGVSVDVADRTHQRGLQNAVMGNSLEIVKLLVAQGANIDRPTTRFGGAMGFAAHFNRRAIAAFLAPLSRDVLNLTHLAMKERLHELFTEDPSLANWPHPERPLTPLFGLPDNEDEAADMAAFLLAHGTDPTIRNQDGLTAAEVARQRGLIDAADAM